MNIIYKVIWHASLGIWIAVSELAKGHSKSQNNMQHPRQRSQDQIKTQKPLFIHFKRQAIVQCFLLIAVYPMVTQLSARSLTLGDYAQATGVNSLVISMANSSANAVVASSSNTIAIGYNTKATDNDAIAFGRDTISSGWDSIAFGYGSQAKAYYSLAFGSQAVATSVNSVAMGKFAIASNANALAFGTGAAASGLSGIAFGELARATNTNAMAFGVGALANSNASIAIGNNSKAVAMNAIALGNNAVANATNSIGIGYSAQVTGVGSVAMGSGANVVADNAVGLGRLTNASLANAVALGVFSTTASNATNIAAVSQNGLTFTNFAGKVSDTGRQVSVGYAGFERQIKHVGSGEMSATSTDAVNGSQLFATNTVLANSANSTKTILGGNAALASDGSLSMTNIGGTGKNTIHDAILAARNIATAGSNIVVTPTLEADGSTSYQIATSADLKGLNSVETIDGTKKTTMTAANTLIEDGSNITTITAQGTSVTDGSNSSIYTANGLSINGSDVVLNATGLDVGGVSISKMGIDANNQKMTNLAEGNVAANSKDAINGGQIYTVKTDLESLIQNTGTGVQSKLDDLANQTAKALGGSASYDAATGGWTAPSYTVTTNPYAATTSSVNNVADALTGLNSAVNTPLSFTGDSGSSSNLLGSSLAINGDTNLTTVVSQGKAELKLNTDLKGLNSVETIDGTKKTTMTAANTLIEDGSNITTITAEGTSVTDGSNSSIYTANGLSINGSDVVLNATGLDVGGVSISKMGIDANNQKMTNLAEGNVAANSKDAINGGQIYTVKTDLESLIQNTGTGVQSKLDDLANQTAKALGGSASYDAATGGWTAPSYTVTTNPYAATTSSVNNVADALTGLNSAVNTPLSFTGDSGSSSNLLGSSLAINGDTNLTTVVSQGKAELKLNTDLKGLNSVETIDGTKKTIMTAANTLIEDGSNITTITAEGTSVTDGSNSSIYTANGLSINGNDIVLNSSGLNVAGVKISNTGIDVNGKIIANVANGQLATDAVNLSQLDKAIDNLTNNYQAEAGQIDQAIQNIAKSLGANAAYDAAIGGWTAPSYTVTTNPYAATTSSVNNVADALTGLNSAVNTPLSFTGDSGSSSNLLGSSLAINGDTNLTTVVSQGKAELKLNTDLKGLSSVETIDGSKTSIMTAASTTIKDGNEISILSAKGTSVTDGTHASLYGANGLSINGSDVVLNSSGLNVGGVTLSKSGINANAQKITNLADGILDNDATNLAQVKSLINNTSSSLTGLGFSLQADDLQTVNKKLGEAIAVTGDGQNIVTKINNDKLSIQLADQLNISSLNAGGSILNAAGLTVGNTSVNSGGVFIVGGPSLSSSGINAGNKVISNVATGISDTDAVNKGQLDSAISNLKDNVSQVSAGAVQYDKNADGSVNKNAISLAGGNDGTLISNVADGQIVTGSKDAVNGGQLAAVQDNLQTQITENTQNISQIQNQFNSGAIGLVKQSDAHADITVAQQTGGTRVNVAGTDGHRVVTGIKDGTVATGSSDAVTGNQLYANYENMAKSLGGGAKYDNHTWTAPSYTVGEGGNRTTVHDVGSALDALNRTDSTLSARIDTLGTQLDNSFRATNQRIDKIEKHTNAGIAAALAIEAPAYAAGKFTYAVGAAAYRGESAAGISLRRTAEKGTWSMTVGVAADSQGTPAFRVGIGGVID